MTLLDNAIFLALAIFLLRVTNSAIGTVRLVVMTRQRPLLTAILGFIEALIFAIVAGSVITDLSNVLNLLAYCGGFAAGIYVGMELERRLVISYVRVNIISPNNGHEIAEKLRAMGHGVTEMQAVGASGEVTMISSVAPRLDTPTMIEAAHTINPTAFITVEEARSIQHGWIHKTHGQHK